MHLTIKDYTPIKCLYFRVIQYFVVLLIFSISAIYQPAFGQDGLHSDLDTLIEKLDSAGTAYASVEYHFPFQDSNKNIESLFSISADSSQPFSAEIAELKAEEHILRGDYGLDLQAGYLENFSTGFLGEEGIFYKRRARVGLEWDILNNGLVENRYKVQELRKEQNALFSQQFHAVPNVYFERLRHRIAYSFGLKKEKILESHLRLLSQQEEILIALYHHDYVTWDEVLDLTSEKARIDRLLRTRNHLNDELTSDDFEALDVENLPLLDLNLSKFEDAVKKQSRSNAANTFNPIADHHVINDISLSASVDYNFYSSAPEESLTGIDDQREFVSVGLNISIPFPLQIKENNALVEAKRRTIAEETLRGQKEQGSKIYKIYGEYQSLLAEYERDYKSYQMYNEQIRKLTVKKQINDPAYSPLQLMNVLDDRYKKMIELHNNHRTMYEKLLEAYELTYEGSVREYVHRVKFSRPQKGVVPKYGWSIYIWSPTFEKYSSKSLLGYISEQNFDTIFLSSGTNPNVQKVQSFIDEAHTSGISVEMMVGDNNLLFESHRQEVVDNIAFAKQVGADGLHLDVEPQTFDDWNQKKQFYKELYLGMAKKAFAETQKLGLTLSLSVPVYFDSIIQKLSGNADSIQLMAYGTENTQQIKSRTKEELKNAAQKIAIALRPTDFKNFQTFQTSVEQLKNKMGVYRYSIHDLEALLKIQDLKLSANK